MAKCKTDKDFIDALKRHAEAWKEAVRENSPDPSITPEGWKRSLPPEVLEEVEPEVLDEIFGKSEPNVKEHVLARKILLDPRRDEVVKQHIREKSLEFNLQSMTELRIAAEAFIENWGVDVTYDTLRDPNSNIPWDLRVILNGLLNKEFTERREYDKVIELTDLAIELSHRHARALRAFAEWAKVDEAVFAHYIAKTHDKLKKDYLGRQDVNTSAIISARDEAIDKAKDQVIDELDDPTKEKGKFWGYTASELNEKRKKAWEKWKKVWKGGKLFTGVPLTPEQFEALGELGWYEFVAGARTLNDWLSAMSQSNTSRSELQRIWNGWKTFNGKTMKELSEFSGFTLALKAGIGNDNFISMLEDYGFSKDKAKDIATHLNSRYKEIAKKQMKKLAIEGLIASGQGRKKKALDALDKTIAENIDFSLEDFEAALLKEYGLDTISKEDTQEVLDEFQDIKLEPEGILREQRMVELMTKVAHKFGKKGWAGLPTALWYAAILSGPPTHMVNFSSNTATLILESILSYTNAAVFTKDKRKDPGFTFFTLANMARSQFYGLGRGLTDFRSIWRGKQPAKKSSKFYEEAVIEAVGREEFGKSIKTLGSDAVRVLVWGAKYIPRAMTAVDAVFYHSLNGMRTAELVSRASQFKSREDLVGEIMSLGGMNREVLEGKTEKELRRIWVNETLYNSTEQYKIAKEQVFEELEKTMEKKAQEKLKRLDVRESEGEDVSDERARIIADEEKRKEKLAELHRRELEGEDITKEREKLLDYNKLQIRQRRSEIIDARIKDMRITEDADYFASFGTYNYKPTGLLGAAAEGINTFHGKSKGASRVIVPFTYIVANVLNHQLDYTPYGILRASGITPSTIGAPYVRDAALPSVKQRQPDDIAVLGKYKIPEYRFRTLTKGVLSLILMRVILDMFFDEEEREKGSWKIHGRGPGGSLEGQKREEGWIPYSIEIGGAYYGFQNTPLGLWLGILGNTVDTQRYDHNVEGWGRALGSSLQTVAPTAFEMSFLRDLGGFAAAMADPNRTESWMENFLTKTAGSAFPALFKTMDRAFNPELLDAKTFNEKFAVHIPTPYVRGLWKDVPVRFNYRGQPIERTGNAFTRIIGLNRIIGFKKEQNKIDNLFLDRDVGYPEIQRPFWQVEGENRVVEADDDEYRKYIEMVGLFAEAKIIQNYDRLNKYGTEITMDPKGKQTDFAKALGQIVDQPAKAAAKDIMQLFIDAGLRLPSREQMMKWATIIKDRPTDKEGDPISLGATVREDMKKQPRR